MDLLDARRTLRTIQIDSATARNDYSKALAAWEAGTRRFGAKSNELVKTSGAPQQMCRRYGNELSVRRFFALSLALAALVSACDNGDAKSDVARPRLENGRIVFPQDSPQLGSFATEPVRESTSQQLRLSGAWSGTKTAR